MRWTAMPLWLAVVGCGGGDEDTGLTGTTPVGTATGTTTVGFDCATDVPSLPLPVSARIPGFTGAEDFALDDKGRYVATDDFGNIVRITMDGDQSLWSPNFGESAGTAFLPDGSLAMANVSQGQVQRVRKNGATETLVGGLSYPNGVTVDMDGVVYVADQNLGEIYAYNSETDVLEVLASGLFNPNGLALSVDHQTLYVGSFGGGTVHSIDLAGGGGAVLFGSTPQGTTTTTTTTPSGCAGLAVGDECFLDYIGLGECDAAGDCVLAPDFGACSGRAEGDGCVTDTLGLPNASVCVPHPTLGQLFCPEVPGDVVTPCVGLFDGDSCTARGIDRECRDSWEGILVCDITRWDAAAELACDSAGQGDDCIVIDYEGYADGTCETSYYGPGLTCDPGWYGGGGYEFHGGLDGVQVDACGYVWVTEYTLGYVWRFPPTGGEPELAVDTGTFWIPNMHWGHGVGGWDENTMYMQDRSTDELLVIPIGIPGAPIALRLGETTTTTE